jgi:hypothetical protein
VSSLPQPPLISSAAPTASLHCWRCQEMFVVPAVDGDRLDGWWLCGLCSLVLVPDKAVPS